MSDDLRPRHCLHYNQLNGSSYADGLSSDAEMELVRAPGQADPVDTDVNRSIALLGVVRRLLVSLNAMSEPALGFNPPPPVTPLTTQGCYALASLPRRPLPSDRKKLGHLERRPAIHKQQRPLASSPHAHSRILLRQAGLSQILDSFRTLTRIWRIFCSRHLHSSTSRLRQVLLLARAMRQLRIQDRPRIYLHSLSIRCSAIKACRRVPGL